MKYNNIGEMFFAKRTDCPDKIAYKYKKNDEWLSVTYEQAISKAERIAAGLAAMGLKKGDKAAIISANCLEWALIDYAAASLGAVLVTIYPSVLKEQVQYILKDSDSKAVFALDNVQMEKVDSVRQNLSELKLSFVIDSKNSKIDNQWKSLEVLMEQGGSFLKQNPDYLKKSIAAVKPDDWLTLIYTSGTTRDPKGVILTHKNLLSNIESGLQAFEVGPTDTFLSFLPLSHVFERMAGHYLAYYAGATIAYAVSMDSVANDMPDVKPTIMTSVPRLYEKMYARVLENIEQGSAVKQKIFHWAVKVGKVYINKLMYNKPVGVYLRFKRGLAFKLVFSKLVARVGGCIRFMISGGAPLSGEIAEFFGAAGIMILEGYGLTETSPVLSANRLEKFRYGTIGPIVPGVEVKIAEDGEICARGPNIMVGYYKKENETKEVIDKDGWFHTGDIGHIDEDGFLTITDRKKNILVTAGGKNIAPQPIENMMATSKYIEQFVMIGDRRRFCSAVVVPAEDPLKKWADAEGKKYNNYAELVSLPGVNDLIMSEINQLSAELASYESIKKIFIPPAPFTIETGELTPSLKVKRKVVLDKYSNEIEAMYK